MEEERLITSCLKEEDEIIEQSLRPKLLSEYIGQEKVKEKMHIFIEAAKQNICVLALVLLVEYFVLRAFIALLRREDTVLKVKWVYVWVFIAFFIVFAVVRNLLLVYAGIDPLGDNKAFWGW